MRQVLNDGQKVRFAVPIIAVEEAYLGAAGADVVGEVVLDDAQPALTSYRETWHLLNRHAATTEVFDDGARLHWLQLFQRFYRGHTSPR